jgi:enoyl-CoA hydratase
VTSPKIEAVDGTLLIRFDRPDLRNSLSVDIIESLLNAIEQLDFRSVSKIVFTGTGDAFASGADLREIRDLTAGSARAFGKKGQELMAKVDDLSIPTMAAINGYCFGGGLDLALACDIRIASPNAVFCHPGVGLGIITGWGGTQRLPRLIGEARAMEMLLTAGRVSASEALRIGLIHDITDDVLTAAFDDTPNNI